MVECRTPERVVGGSKPTAAVLCPWARHFTPQKYWLIAQEAVAPSRHDWKIVDWDVKPQHNQPTNHASSFIFDQIIIKVACNQDRHKSLDVLILGLIRILTLELLALEWRKSYTFELEYLWGQFANLDQILCVASLGVGKGCIMFWGRLDQNSGVHGNRKPPLTYNGENGVSTFSQLLRPLVELLALEWRKFHTFELEYLWSQLANLEFGWWCPDIFKSSTMFPVCFGLLTARVFRKHAKHIESSNISMPGLLIT